MYSKCHGLSNDVSDVFLWVIFALMHVYQSYFEKLLVTELCLGMSSNARSPNNMDWFLFCRAKKAPRRRVNFLQTKKCRKTWGLIFCKLKQAQKHAFYSLQSNRNLRKWIDFIGSWNSSENMNMIFCKLKGNKWV